MFLPSLSALANRDYPFTIHSAVKKHAQTLQGRVGLVPSVDTLSSFPSVDMRPRSFGCEQLLMLRLRCKVSISSVHGTQIHHSARNLIDEFFQASDHV